MPLTSAIRKAEGKTIQSAPVLVKAAEYVEGFVLRIFFSDGQKKTVDFESFLNSKKGHLKLYRDPAKFKKFRIENGNLVWGKNWDLIFPIDELYKRKIK